MGPTPCPRLAAWKLPPNYAQYFLLPRTTALEVRALVPVFNHTTKICQGLKKAA